MRRAESWAAGVDYTYRRVNLIRGAPRDIGRLYGVSGAAVLERHHELVGVLDIMPCDYRYYAGADNPLDRLVEAASMLDDLERRFRDPTAAT